MDPLTRNQAGILKTIIEETRVHGPPTQARIRKLTGISQPGSTLAAIKLKGYLSQPYPGGLWHPIKTPAGGILKWGLLEVEDPGLEIRVTSRRRRLAPDDVDLSRLKRRISQLVVGHERFDLEITSKEFDGAPGPEQCAKEINHNIPEVFEELIVLLETPGDHDESELQGLTEIGRGLSKHYANDSRFMLGGERLTMRKLDSEPYCLFLVRKYRV